MEIIDRFFAGNNLYYNELWIQGRTLILQAGMNSELLTLVSSYNIMKGNADMRVGMGYDVHKLVEGRRLILGGVDIPYEKGLLGHSDADVLLHAIMDALLGAAALGDIGQHFPDTDDKYKGADSLVLLKEVGRMLDENNYIIENIDATIIAQRPKMAPHIPDMRQNIARTLGIELNQINVKATTEEVLGFTGSGEGISAQDVCSISSVANYIYGEADMKNCCNGCGGCGSNIE